MNDHNYSIIMDTIDEKLSEAAIIESDIQHLSLKELVEQKNGLSSRINHLTNEISDLAFNNYRTYADAGRTAEHCKEKFSNIHNNINGVKVQMPKLTESVKGFFENTKTFHKEYDVVTSINDRNNLLWKITAMPQMIEKCIQMGEYESAFALTDFAVNIKSTRLYNIPIIKKPIDYIIEARHGLLDELFDKFAGPIDLAKNILIVNNIRKIPYISNTQLRISILHYRDIYLENLVNDAMKEPDYIYKLVDIYRDCMYDTMVLYLAVFPDSDTQRKLATSNDPRWERWTGSSQNYLLQAWAHKNLIQLFEQIKNYTVQKINYEALRDKLMSFASSFGRMGLDFRLLVLDELKNVDIKIFHERLSLALMSLIEKRRINLVDSHIVEMAKTGLMQNSADVQNTIPIEMIAWDDLVIYANELITGLNDLRFSLSVNQINDIFNIIENSFNQLSSWIDGFFDEDAQIAKRASKILIEDFVSFIQLHFKSSFINYILDKWITSNSLNENIFTFKINSKSYEEYCNDNDNEEESSFATIPDTTSNYDTDSTPAKFGNEMIDELKDNFANFF